MLLNERGQVLAAQLTQNVGDVTIQKTQSDLPSFIEGNPWVDILKDRVRELNNAQYGSQTTENDPKGATSTARSW